MFNGKNMYHGPTGEMMPHSNAQGYQCELHDNPADFVLDLLIDASRNSEELKKLYDAYDNSTVLAAMKMLLKKQSKIDATMHDRRQPRGTTARSFTTETFYVAQRTLKNAFRNPILFLSQILVSIVLGLLIGLVFYDLKKTTEPGAQNRLGAIFFMIISQIFSTVTAVEPLLKERALFIHVSSE
jgi:ATP-binding cassette, subfamily G (WHITE), member 2